MATVKRHLIRVLAGCTVWLTLTGGGCNLFQPAQPEPPTGEAIIPDYSDPDRTLDTIAQAVRDKHASSVYMGAFADSTSPATPAYHHFFWPTDVIDTGNPPPADWTDYHEEIFYSRLVNWRGDAYQFIWGPDDASGSDDIGANRAVIHRHYRLISETDEGNFTGTIAFGFADLTLVKGTDGNWRITIWSDRVDPTAEVGQEEVSLGFRRLTGP